MKVIIILLVVIVLVGGGYYLFSNNDGAISEGTASAVDCGVSTVAVETDKASENSYQCFIEHFQSCTAAKVILITPVLGTRVNKAVIGKEGSLCIVTTTYEEFTSQPEYINKTARCLFDPKAPLDAGEKNIFNGACSGTLIEALKAKINLIK